MAIELFSKHSLVSGNTPANLEQGELAVNIPDRRLFVGGENGGSIVKLYYGTTNYFDDNGYANRAKTLNGYTHNDFIKPSDLKPAIAIYNGQINFSVAGEGSEFITVPYATSAGSADSADYASRAGYAKNLYNGSNINVNISYSEVKEAISNIATLSNDVSGFQTALNTTNTNVTNLTTTVGSHSTSIQNLGNDISTINENIADILSGDQTVGYATSAQYLKYNNNWRIEAASAGVNAKGTFKVYDIPSSSSSSKVIMQVSNNGNVTAVGDFEAFTASDKALKDNITPIKPEDALKVVKSLNPVNFDWNDTATSLSGRLKGHSQGFIAQEYEKIIPNSSRLMWDEYKGIDYLQSIPYIVAVEQNHESRIERLEKKVKELEKRLAKYESID